MITLSIDPGKAGAITVFNDLAVVSIHDIPQVKWGSKQSLPDTKKVLELFQRYAPDLIVIERITSSPTDGVSSSSNFTQGLGRLEGCAAAWRVEYVIPRVWKAASGLIRTDKKSSLSKAISIHPESEEFLIGFKNKIDRADSVLIGSFYLRFKEKLILPCATETTGS